MSKGFTGTANGLSWLLNLQGVTVDRRVFRYYPIIYWVEIAISGTVDLIQFDLVVIVHSF